MEKDISISKWLDSVLAKGMYGFSKESIHQQLPDLSEVAVKRALNRLSKNGKIVSLFKGYYVIITPQFASKGILPPEMYLDNLMNYLHRPYYMALLNAAVFHGASHQQPQEYFVVTGFPVLRTTHKKGLKLNYISVKEIHESLIEKKKTVSGYLNISNAILTACDLIQFEKRVGGLNRVAEILNELVEVIKPSDFTDSLLGYVHVTVFQRLGYLLEYVLFNKELSDSLFQKMKEKEFTLFRTPLDKTNEIKGCSSNNRWKVIVNTTIDIDT